MRNLTKGVLLNALVLPGIGQLVLKRPLRGWLYIACCVACVIVLFRVILGTAISVVNSNAALSTGTVSLTEQVKTELVQNGGPIATYALAGFMLIWVIALVDVIVTGRSAERQAAANAKTSRSTP